MCPCSIQTWRVLGTGSVGGPDTWGCFSWHKSCLRPWPSFLVLLWPHALPEDKAPTALHKWMRRCPSCPDRKQVGLRDGREPLVSFSNSSPFGMRLLRFGKAMLPLGLWGFPDGSDSKESAWNTGDLGSIPGFGRFLGEGNGNPLQYSCLENSHEQRSLVGYSSWGCKESDTAEQLTLITS